VNREIGIEKRRSVDPHDYQDLPRPLAAMAKDFPPGAAIERHSHPRAQLVFAVAGVMTVTTPQGIWVVPPHRALWIPARVEHAIRCSGAVAMRTLYIRPDAGTALPDRVAVVGVSPLLRELILAAVRIEPIYDEAGRDGQVMALALQELRSLPTLPLHLPMPSDPRLAHLCERIKADPANTWTVAAAAREAGVSGRTLARHFRIESGLGFAAWCRQARLLAALVRLAGGEKVTSVALDCGYDSPSAFTSMFRRHIGVPPSRYFL
jgi:AraC-like DNA-binding protein/quercetin dioxygenase-like cupin family protein